MLYQINVTCLEFKGKLPGIWCLPEKVAGNVLLLNHNVLFL